jgi:hypothetical protein
MGHSAPVINATTEWVLPAALRTFRRAVLTLAQSSIVTVLLQQRPPTVSRH